jgi:hypothetical protein
LRLNDLGLNLPQNSLTVLEGQTQIFWFDSARRSLDACDLTEFEHSASQARLDPNDEFHGNLRNCGYRSSPEPLPQMLQTAARAPIIEPVPDSVTGRIIDVLRRAALQGIADKTQKVGLVQLQVVGAKMPSVVGQRA